MLLLIASLLLTNVQLSDSFSLKGVLCENTFASDKSCDFQSEGFGVGLPYTTNCSYVLQADANKLLSIKFDSFSIDPAAKVLIYDGLDENQDPIGSLINGTDHLYQYVSSSNSLKIRYISPVTKNKGFRVTCVRPSTDYTFPTVNNTGDVSSNIKLDLSNAVYNKFQSTYTIKINPEFGNITRLSNLKYNIRGTEGQCVNDSIKLLADGVVSNNLCGDYSTGAPDIHVVGLSELKIQLQLNTPNTELNQLSQFVSFHYEFTYEEEPVTTTTTLEPITTAVATTGDTTIVDSTTQEQLNTTVEADTTVVTAIVTSQSATNATSDANTTETAGFTTTTPFIPTTTTTLTTTTSSCSNSTITIYITNAKTSDLLIDVQLNGVVVGPPIAIGSYDQFEAKCGDKIRIQPDGGIAICEIVVPDHNQAYIVQANKPGFSITCQRFNRKSFLQQLALIV